MKVLTDSLDYVERETQHDISFNMGYKWAGLEDSAREFIMDEVGGSQGLAELAASWAKEFDVEYAVKLVLNPDNDDYLLEVDNFFFKKWNEFMATQLAARMTA